MFRSLRSLPKVRKETRGRRGRGRRGGKGSGVPKEEAVAAAIAEQARRREAAWNAAEARTDAAMLLGATPIRVGGARRREVEPRTSPAPVAHGPFASRKRRADNIAEAAREMVVFQRVTGGRGAVALAEGDEGVT